VPLPDGSFDVVYAANLLHHVDVGATLKEARRLLKDGGIFASYDPIAYNPLINVYRRMATQVRTDDEHPLRARDLSVVRQTFPEVRMEFTWFATLWLFMKFFLIDRINPNKDRYWKRVLREHVALESAYLALERIDKHMLKICPFMKWFCWNVVIIGRK
jgi:SAM-dependent methyltransferase